MRKLRVFTRSSSRLLAARLVCTFAACGLALTAGCAEAGVDVAAQSDAPLLLVSQAASGTLGVVDPALGRVRKHIEVGQLPHRLLATRDGSRVYAVLVGSQAVAEIDTHTLALRRTFLTAPVPMQREDGSDIAAHAERAAADHTTCFDCHRPGGVKPAIVGERPVGIALSADESKLYVSHIQRGRLSVIELESGRLERSELLPPTASASEAADLARLDDVLVVSMRPTQPSTDPGAVRFLAEATFEPRAEFRAGSDPAALLAVPQRSSVLAAQFETNRIHEFAVEREPRAFTVTPGPLGTALLPGGLRVLSLNYYSNSASLLDLASGEVTQLSLQLEGRTFVNPTHAAISPAGDTAYIVSSGTEGHLLLLDLATLRVRSAISIDGLSFDVVTIPRNATAL